jgi:hypothetical protein
MCPDHKVKWCEVSDLFSDWREESEADWLEAAEVLETCMEIEPIRDIRDSQDWIGGKRDEILSRLESESLQYSQPAPSDDVPF